MSIRILFAFPTREFHTLQWEYSWLLQKSFVHSKEFSREQKNIGSESRSGSEIPQAVSSRHTSLHSAIASSPSSVIKKFPSTFLWLNNMEIICSFIETLHLNIKDTIPPQTMRKAITHICACLSFRLWRIHLSILREKYANKNIGFYYTLQMLRTKFSLHLQT